MRNNHHAYSDIHEKTLLLSTYLSGQVRPIIPERAINEYLFVFGIGSMVPGQIPEGCCQGPPIQNAYPILLEGGHNGFTLFAWPDLMRISSFIESSTPFFYH